MDRVSRTSVSYFSVPATCYGVVYNNVIHLTFDPIMGYIIFIP